MKGADLEGITFRHPLYERDSLGVTADYVTLEAGTGAVHTAPGHGADDFLTGKRYGLDIYAPVGPDGRFLDTVELFAGARSATALYGDGKHVDAVWSKRPTCNSGGSS